VTHPLVNCEKATVIASLPFSTGNAMNGWGILLCRPSFSFADGNYLQGGLAGLIGPRRWRLVEEPRSGVALDEQDLAWAAGTMLLTCGLSVLAAGGVEGGDMMVVSGTGPLAAALLSVGKIQGVNCLQPQILSQLDRRGSGNFLVDLLNPSWREDLAGSDQEIRGRLVFFDLTGDAQQVAAILPNLGRMGRLVLCRQDKPLPLVFNAYRDLHRTSAEVRSWSLMPGTPAFEGLPRAYRRAQQLMRWRKKLVGEIMAWKPQIQKSEFEKSSNH